MVQSPFMNVFFFDITTTANLQALAMSCALIGCIVGAVVSGVISDKFGRKWPTFCIFIYNRFVGYRLGFKLRGICSFQNHLRGRYWELAKDGNTEPAAATFYNDQKPDKIFYQGLALLKLGLPNEANIRFDK